MTSTVAKLIWIIGLIKEFGVDVKLPVKIYSDTKAAIQLAANQSIMNEQNTLR